MVLYAPAGRYARWMSTYNDWGASISYAYPSGLATITTGIDSNDSATVAMGSALTFEGGYVIVDYAGTHGSNIDSRSMLDIMIDRAGGTSWESSPFIADVFCGFASTDNARGMVWEMPVRVPAGASLGIRARTLGSAARTLRVGLTVLPRHGLPPWMRVGQKVVAIGTASLGGTAVSNSGSWVNVGAPLARDTSNLLLVWTGTNTGSISGNSVLLAQIGAGSQPLWAPQVSGFAVGNEQWYGHRARGFSICPRVIPAGTQLQVRLQTTTADDYAFAIYGTI